jgi:hypothetical protein
MPYSTDYSGTESITRYGILDCMVPRLDRTAEPRGRAVWCSLPGADGEPELLLWTSAGAADKWLRWCVATRQAEGGPATYLPFGWYGAREISECVRAAFSPWEEHTPGSPLLRREGDA